MTETTETTTEPTTLHEHLKRLAACEDLDLGFWRFTVPEGGLAVIQRAIEDAATRPLQEEVERMKERQEADNDQYRFIVSQLVGNQSKYDALKAKADALRDAGDKLSAEAEHMFSLVEDQYEWRAVGEAVDAWRDLMQADAAEPREETHDGPSAGRLDTADDRVPDSGDGVSGGDCGDGVSAVAAPSPDRDGEPGEGAKTPEYGGILAEPKSDVEDLMYAHEERISLLNRDIGRVDRMVAERLDAIGRRIDEIRSNHSQLGNATRTDWAASMQRMDGLHRRLAALEAERDPGAVPTVTPEAINAFCAMLENTPYEQLTTEGRYYVRRGLEAALKAGGAK